MISRIQALRSDRVTGGSRRMLRKRARVVYGQFQGRAPVDGRCSRASNCVTTRGIGPSRNYMQRNHIQLRRLLIEATQISISSRRSTYLALILIAAGCGGGASTPNPPDNPPINELFRWSDSATWEPGAIPGPSDNVLIGAGRQVILDIATAPLGSLVIEGTLTFDPTVDVSLTATDIEIRDGGLLQVGTSTNPYQRQAFITLTGPRGYHANRQDDNALDNDGISRSIRVLNGGELELFGSVVGPMRAKLDTNASAGAASFNLSTPVTWRAGDRVAIATTDFYGIGVTELFTLAADSIGSTIVTSTALATARWGALQYPMDATLGGSAMSLTPETFTPPSPATPTVLDERASVVNLSRRIVIQGADDSDWNQDGFGVHVMIMGLQSKARVQGVELRRCGQRRAMGRYPWHWHMLSYSEGTGAHLGDVVQGAQFLRESSVWNSANRAVTIHGTNGVEVDEVYAFDVFGHAFFFEDGSERRNTIENCIALKVRSPGSNRLKEHDTRASGFWLTNPDNTIVGNLAADCDGFGFWNAFSTECFGLSRNVDMNPNALAIRRFDHNVGHSCQRTGIVTEFPVVDESGVTLEAFRYEHTEGDIEMVGNVAWKNNRGGYQNRVRRPIYRAWTLADNFGLDVFGATGHESELHDFLLVGRSLNSTVELPNNVRRALASYHWSIDVINIVAINYPFVAGILAQGRDFTYGGGVLDTSDLYTDSVSLGMFRNEGWRLINSNAGFHSLPPYFDGFPLAMGNQMRHGSLSAAMWDPHGYWGPAGNYLIPDFPFYTFGLGSIGQALPSGENGVSTSHVFYGMGSINPGLDVPPWSLSTEMELRLERIDDGGVVVGEHTIGPRSSGGDFSRFRHFGLARGGRYRLVLPGAAAPDDYFSLTLSNAYRSTDNVVIGLPWDGNSTAAGRIDSGYDQNSLASRIALGTARLLVNSGSSLQDVIDDPSGATMWQDRPANMIWLKHVGGLALNLYNYDGRNDASLLRDQQVRLWSE